MKKVDHIGIAVKDLEQVLPYYTETLGCPLMKIEEVEGQKVKVAFIDAGNIKLELLEPMSEDSPIHKFIEKKAKASIISHSVSTASKNAWRNFVKTVSIY